MWNLIVLIVRTVYKRFSDDKKDQAPPPPASKSEAEKMDEKKLKMEAAINDLDTKIKAFEEKENKYDYKIELIKKKAKELIAAG